MTVSAFFFAGPEHQIADGFAGVLTCFEDELHLRGDGHFNVMLAGKTEGGVRGVYAFSNLAAERVENLRQLAALAELLSDRAIAAERAGAGEHEIADSGESGEGLAPSAAGDGQARHLGDSARDERGC